MLEAGLVSIVCRHFVEHPGMIIWLCMLGFIQRYLLYKTFIPHGLTIFIAGGLATLLLRIVSQTWFNSFLGYFTDLAHH